LPEQDSCDGEADLEEWRTAQEIDAYKRSLPTLKTQIKWEIKNKIMSVVDRILPKGTKRREAVKRIWRKIRK
jgi:hypothetical protein